MFKIAWDNVSYYKNLEKVKKFQIRLCSIKTNGMTTVII